MLEGYNTLIRNTCDYLDIINKDDKNRFECQTRQALIKNRRRKDTAAYKKWLEEGKEEKATEIAMYLLKKGISTQTVAEATGLKFSIVKGIMCS